MSSVFADDGIHTFVLRVNGSELSVEIRKPRDGWGVVVKVPASIAAEIARQVGAAKGKAVSGGVA